MFFCWLQGFGRTGADSHSGSVIIISLIIILLQKCCCFHVRWYQPITCITAQRKKCLRTLGYNHLCSTSPLLGTFWEGFDYHFQQKTAFFSLWYFLEISAGSLRSETGLFSLQLAISGVGAELKSPRNKTGTASCLEHTQDTQMVVVLESSPWKQMQQTKAGSDWLPIFKAKFGLWSLRSSGVNPHNYH